MMPTFSKLQAGDICEDLILMWRAIQAGWKPPMEVPFDQYEEVRRQVYPSAMRGFVGFGCSTYGKWFGGYARNERGNNNSTKVGDSARSCLRAAPHLARVRFFLRSFDAWKLDEGDVVYCDPPYKETTGYEANDGFDHAYFWAWCKQQADRGVRVIVSESTPPPMDADQWVQAWYTGRTCMIGDTSYLDRKDHQIHDALYVPRWLAPQAVNGGNVSIDDLEGVG